jgi:hypothetical protein
VAIIIDIQWLTKWPLSKRERRRFCATAGAFSGNNGRKCWGDRAARLTLRVLPPHRPQFGVALSATGPAVVASNPAGARGRK